MLSYVSLIARNASYRARCGISERGPLLSSGMDHSTARRLVAAARNNQAVGMMRLLLPRMRGCQLKMTLGIPCLRATAITALLLELARRWSIVTPYPHYMQVALARANTHTHPHPHTAHSTHA